MLKKFFRKRLDIHRPAFIQIYLQNFAEKKSYDILIDDAEFVIIDLETTGLNISKDEILSIGAVRLMANKINIETSLELYLKHSEYYSDSIKVHGILTEGKEEKIEKESALREFLDFIGSSVLVGHNVQFDISMINKELKRFGKIKLANPVIDTKILYERLNGRGHIITKKVTLEQMCHEFGIAINDRHTAPGDAFITAILFVKLLSRLRKRGVTRIKDLLKDNKRLF